MPPITDPTALATVIALNADVEEAARAVQAAADAVSEAVGRRTQLRQSLADHDKAEPSPDAAVTDELSRALAADPGAAKQSAWAEKLRDSQAATVAAVTAWKSQRTVIDQALARVSAEVEDREGARDTARAHHERAWTAFVNGARIAMTAELELRFADFYAAVLGPLDALNQAKALYSPKPVFSGPRRQVTHDSVLAIGTPGAGGGMTDRVKLYPSDDADKSADLLADFRRQLADAQPRKARARE